MELILEKLSIGSHNSDKDPSKSDAVEYIKPILLELL